MHIFNLHLHTAKLKIAQGLKWNKHYTKFLFTTNNVLCIPLFSDIPIVLSRPKFGPLWMHPILLWIYQWFRSVFQLRQFERTGKPKSTNLFQVTNYYVWKFNKKYFLVLMRKKIIQLRIIFIFLPVEHRSYNRVFKISSTILKPPTPYP